MAIIMYMLMCVRKHACVCLYVCESDCFNASPFTVKTVVSPGHYFVTIRTLCHKMDTFSAQWTQLIYSEFLYFIRIYL